ncbi:RHS repeat-associated core domain-containing protein [Pseudomonas sp. CAM1A]|uniref:RHS repeat-associated core domain-containing protein n=1 Tax=Pseudomonas sp. CAM1A TaxID=3231717 RepID=UPI0039C634B4
MFKTKLFASDQLLSPGLVLDASGYALASYTPFGDRCALTGFARMGFTGQFRESESGSYLLGNGRRAYNAQLMRFHSPDTLSPFDAGGLNSYAYCKGDPVNMTDPSGNVPGYKATVMGNSPALYVAGKMMVTSLYNRTLPNAQDAVVALATAAVGGLGMYGALLQYQGEPLGDDYANWTTAINGAGTTAYLLMSDVLKGGTLSLEKVREVGGKVVSYTRESFRTRHAGEIAMADMVQSNKKLLSTFTTQHSVVEVRARRPGSTSSDSEPELSTSASSLRQAN